MAILANVDLPSGESRLLYLRVNNACVSDHGIESTALIRGYISEEAFNNGSSYVFEDQVTLIVDVSGNIWQQIENEMKVKYQ